MGRVEKMKPRHRKVALEIGGQRKYRMCTGKTAYSIDQAKHVAMLFNQRKYECPICGRWHLTKNL